MIDMFQRMAIDNILAPFLFSVAMAVATIVVGWVGVLYTKITREKMDQKHQTSIQSALANGMVFAIQVVLNGRVPQLMDPTTRQALIEEGIKYVRTSVPDAVKHFELDDWTMGKLLLPKLPVTIEGTAKEVNTLSPPSTNSMSTS